MAPIEFDPNYRTNKICAVLSEGRSMQKCVNGGRGLKYIAPNINVCVLMIFTAFLLKSDGGGGGGGEVLAPPTPSAVLLVL